VAADRIRRLAEFAREQEAVSSMDETVGPEAEAERPTQGTPRERRFLRPDVLAKRAAELSDQGWSYRRIAREFGVAHSTVRNCVIQERGGGADQANGGEGGAQ
jgi:DNA-binding NarL/FixJ family response regulator